MNELERGGLSVLMVENNTLVRAMLRSFLQEAYPAMAIHEAPDATSARGLVDHYRPGIVLMDINLPDGNGVELAAEIMKVLPRTKVIMVTLLAGAPYEERAREAGAFAYVVKDRLYSDLPDALRRALQAIRAGTAGSSGSE